MSYSTNASFHNLTLLVNKFDLQLYEPLSGIEPEAFALREQRSTNWAKAAGFNYLDVGKSRTFLSRRLIKSSTMAINLLILEPGFVSPK